MRCFVLYVGQIYTSDSNVTKYLFMFVSKWCTKHEICEFFKVLDCSKVSTCAFVWSDCRGGCSRY